ncbi:DNA-directed primase/polymerase protein isoform X2 [Cajanus cajan]|uniref:DNA-directed primase/polymerase protein isoform X2 n=1 Tax=Cajanus cajan TaxID=3821 RepID=UPI0010FB35CD|nr:DNA-directed primase/polymerase protein isoform X2 [Cajanus cajan]
MGKSNTDSSENETKMSSTTSSTNMSDVDRLFACFKCGLTPPKSATRERKRSKRGLEQESSKHEFPSESPGPGQVGGELKTPLSRIRKTNVESSIEKLKSAVARKSQSIGRGKQFSPIVFYGSPHGVPPKRPTRILWRLLREICPDLSQQKKLNIRREVWMTFPRQDEAMKFAKGQEDVHVFSYQDHCNGQRRFLVCTYKEFWRRYKNMDPKFRHHYEVIQEGLPCHLYFDLEFNKKVNIGKNGEEMVDLLISVVLEALREKYAIHGDHNWVVELDSSTEDKFSRHIIVRIPKVAFKDNSHAGAFVSEICSRILNARGEDKSFEKLLVMKDSSSNESAGQLFVDTAVYSRNRCFRLLLSSKAGKSSVLLPTKRFKCKDLSQGEEDMFMASLICNMDVDCKTFLVCKTDLDCVKTLHFDTEENSNVGNSCHIPSEFTLDTRKSEVSTTYFMGKSPFPFLDKFILSVASVGNIPGKIQSWYFFSEFGLMVYSMTKNRYCERIGRQHKSNNVIYVVDLRMAVYYQKCHDPECRGYRSPMRQIPVHVFSNPSDVIDSFGLLDDEQPVDDKWRHQLDDNKEQSSLQYEDIVADNSNDSWWLEAIRVVEDMENKQTQTELSTMEVIDDEDEEWWLAAEKTASQAELNCFSQQEFCAT